MNPSYGHLAILYDRLFPLDPEALALVQASIPQGPGHRVVDAGCGTGLMARALGDQGTEVFAFDLDPDLLAVARSREGRGVRFATGDLRTWALPADLAPPEGVLCLGNTLPHLTTESELDAFLGRTARQLAPGGVFLVQILDYDYLAATGPNQLPERSVDGWLFRRRYEIQPDGLWTFHTSLEGGGTVLRGAFPLRPWRRSVLETALERHGLVVEGVWGGFDLRPAGSSLPLVFRARLGLE